MFCLYDELRYTTTSLEQKDVDKNKDFIAKKLLKAANDHNMYDSPYEFKGSKVDDYKAIKVMCKQDNIKI